jgi:hypothetical protein
MTIARFFLAAVTATLVSCSTSSPSNTPAPTEAGAANPDDGIPEGLTASTLKVVIPPHVVEPGDSFECYFTDLKTDRDIYVNSSTGKQGPGGHHLTIYYSTNPQPVGHHKCIDAEMAEMRQVGAASNDLKGDGVIDLPPGIAIEVPAGKQLVVQTHYINATSQPREVEDEITVHLIPKEEVKRFVQSFVVVDGTFEIPPRADYSRTATCTLKRDLSLIMALGHMHERGQHYKLEHLDANGKLLDTVLDQAWETAFTSHPPTRQWSPEQPYQLKAGEKLRQTCLWKNPDSDKVVFPLEMCIAFTMYLDDQGFLECAAEPDAK